MTFEEFLAERASMNKPIELKVGMELGGGLYLGEFKGEHYIVSHYNTEKELPWKEAIEYCKNLSEGGYSDWFLPNKEELKFAYTQFKANLDVLDFDNAWYWSNEVYNDHNSYITDFNGAYQGGCSITAKKHVRAFRKL